METKTFAFLINLLLNGLNVAFLFLNSSPITVALNVHHNRKSRSLLFSGSGIMDMNEEQVEGPYFELENSVADVDRRIVRQVGAVKKIEPVKKVPEKTYDSSEELQNYNKQLLAKQKVSLTEWKERNWNLFLAMNAESDIPFKRITYTSKYMWDQSNQKLKTLKDLSDYCEKYHLETPEVTCESDLKTLLGFLAGQPSLVIGLGITDSSEEGKFIETTINSSSKIQYQAFGEGEPDNGQGAENCVTVSLSIEKEVIMKDVNCDNMLASHICQRRKDSIGFEDSVEKIGNQTDELEMIGHDADNLRFYIGSKQKTWDDANRHCEENMKKLVELGSKEATNQELYNFIAVWKKINGLNWPTGIWTSGQFSKSPTEDKFIWQSPSMNEFDLQKKDILWQWVVGEPADQSGKGLEICIDVSFSASSLNGTIIPKLRASNCYLPFYYVCYEKLEEDMECRENGPMKLTGPHSKFLYDSDSNRRPVTREAAKDICEKWDYELAEVQSITDLTQLQTFMIEKNLQERTWHIGLNDKEREGEFEEDQKAKVLFQAFSVSQPDNKGNEDCVVLVFDQGSLVMEDRSCVWATASVLCQFPKERTKTCFVNSAQNAMKPKDGLIFLGETAIRRYFLSKTQKTWIEAMGFCSSNGKKKLLDLLFIGELNNFKNQLFYPKLVAWSKKYKTGIWTSGRYHKSVEESQFWWQTTMTKFRNDDKTIKFNWAPGEPADTTGRQMEICIELVISHWAKSKPGEPLTPMLKSSNCLLPNYFVCYEDAPHIKNCHIPPKIDVSWKALSETSRYVYADVPKKLNAKDRHKQCKDWGLEVAEISSYKDYMVVSEAFDSWNATSLYFGLGLNSVGSEGLWFEGDGVTPIKFQVFGQNQPMYYQNMEPLDHVVLNKHKSPAWQMSAISEKSFTNVLCQFKPDSSCAFQNIFTYFDRHSPKNYLRKLRDEKKNLPAGNRIYYISDSQQTWEEAMRFCWSNNKRLLDLDVKNVEEANELYKVLAVDLKKKRLHPFVTRLWTSGKYVESWADKTFRWESVWKFESHADVHKRFGLNVIPPPNSTAEDNNRCLTLGLEDIKTINGTYKVNLKTSNCFLPYYYICYSIAPPPEPVVVPNEQSYPDPELPKDREVPLCKEPEDPVLQNYRKDIAYLIADIRPPGYVSCNYQIPVKTTPAPK